MTEFDTALSQLVERVSHNGNQGCFMLLMAEYRPDLARTYAHRLGLPMFDYRKEVMAERGLEAHQISLQELTETLRRESQAKGLLAFNVEALLATKSESERREWLASTLDFAWPNLLILPLTIFSADAPTGSERVLDLSDTKLEDQSLTSRLLH